MNNKGFIATSLIYSFFIIFCALIIAYVGVYMHNTILLNKQKDLIDADLYESVTLSDDRYKIGEYYTLVLGSNLSSETALAEKDTYLSKANYTFILINKSETEATFISKDVLISAYSVSGINERVGSVYIKGLANGKTHVPTYDELNTIKENFSFEDANNIINMDKNENNSYLLSDETNMYIYNTVNADDTDALEANITSSKSNAAPTDPLTHQSVSTRLVISLSTSYEVLGGEGTISNNYILGEVVS